MKPVPKVTAAAIGGGISTIAIWARGIVMPDHPMSPEVGAAIATIIGVAAGWFKRDGGRR
jgi:hypothetical protein